MISTQPTRNMGDSDPNWANPRYINDTRECLSERLGLSIDPVPLGAGYSGVVYRVGKDKALKVLRPLEDLDDEQANFLLSGFKFEAEVLERGQRFTESTPKLYQTGLQGPHSFILMEQLHPKTLKLIASNPRRCGLLDKVKMAGDLTKHLYDLHENNILHKDIKPENITFCRGTEISSREDGSIDFRGARNLKIIDFGGAQEIKGSNSNSSHILGTPAYMAPEQLYRSLGDVGLQTEQFNLAATLYHLTLGEAPNLVDVKRDSQTGDFYVTGVKALDIPPISDRRERVFIDVLRNALKKHPEDRYDSMKEFNQEIKNYFEWAFRGEEWPLTATIQEDSEILRKTGNLIRNGLRFSLGK